MIFEYKLQISTERAAKKKKVIEVVFFGLTS
jgi:hypothetical protein